jgi:hypothetical protein
MRKSVGDSLISWLPLILIVPIGLIAVVSLVGQIPDFFNPCLKWGMSGGGSISESSAGPCSTAGGMSETMPQAIVRLTLVQGGILTAIGVGLVGFLRSRPALLTVGSLILFFESVPLVFDGLFVFTLLGAVSLLWSASRLSSRFCDCPKQAV